jgi:DNA-binding LacI/PurR family transcriptional regulator
LRNVDSANHQPAVRPPTLADVALAAGVSRATASRVANGGATTHRIAPATIRRVETAIRRLGYSANPQAQALRTGRPQAIGILGWNGVLGTWWHPWHIRLLHGVELTLELAGFDPILLGVHRPDQPGHQPAIDALARRQVAGIISLVGLPEPQIDALVAASQGAFVSLMHAGPRGAVACCDLGPGIDAACAHLAGLGHRTLAWADHRRDDDRLALARAAATRHGLRWTAMDLGPDPGVESGAEPTLARLRDAWAGHDAPAVLAGSDLVALAVLDTWRARGLRVPEERSPIGIDDLQAPLAQPALTSISQQWEEVGTAAARHVLAVLAGNRPAPPPPIPSRLIIRASCAAPGKQP